MEKKEYKQYRKLGRLKQGIMIVCMVVCGFYYAFYTRPQEAPRYSFEAAVGTAYGSAGSEAVQPETKDVQAETAGMQPETDAVPAGPESLPESTENASVRAQAPAAAEQRINLNTATAEELDSLPGIGPATAKLIILYREENGGFVTPEEICNVRRIGDKTYEKLKNRICV